MHVDILQIEQLTKSYGQIRALHDVSFNVAAGEIFGYLGPNGAGKTTTLRAIAGLVHADNGEIRLFGEKKPLPRMRDAIGYLPGELHLYADMSAARLLDYFARFRPQRPPLLRKKLLDAFAAGQEVLSRKIKFLSHGTRQKIGLLIAMQHDPELLLLDEPTIGLDPLMQQAFREIIFDFAARGRAVLFSSHVLSEVEAVCNSIAILRAGEIVAIETMAALRGKMLRRLQVRFRAEAPQSVLTCPGVARTHVQGREVVLWVQGEINALLRQLAQVEIEHLVFPEPELEDIFLSFYNKPDRSLNV
ncbi:ABC transporter [candidate division KSB1 bacterium]|nr:MAG: ABC transporter [candidate division KSB1 bacterium]